MFVIKTAYCYNHVMLIGEYIREYTKGERIRLFDIWGEIKEFLVELVKCDKLHSREEFQDVIHFSQLWLYWSFGLDGELWGITRQSVDKFIKRKDVWNRIYRFVGLKQNISGYAGNYEKVEKVVKHLSNFHVKRARALAAFNAIVSSKPQ